MVLRSEPLQLEVRPMDHDLAELADLGMNAERCPHRGSDGLAGGGHRDPPSLAHRLSTGASPGRFRGVVTRTLAPGSWCP